MQRIVVAAAPKSGSTYVTNTLQHYYDIKEEYRVFPFDIQNIKQLYGDRSYVIHMHCYPEDAYEIHRQHQTKFVATWRNLADTIVSFDDFIFADPLVNVEGIFTSAKRLKLSTYPTLLFHQRYEILIPTIVPWYIKFYINWKSTYLPTVFCRYEDMVDDKFNYFVNILNAIEEQPVGYVGHNTTKLATSMEYGKTNSRFNIGKKYRSLQRFSQENREQLEEIIRQSHLPELILELPWNL